jgi:hypothetical protein
MQYFFGVLELSIQNIWLAHGHFLNLMYFAISILLMYNSYNFETLNLTKLKLKKHRHLSTFGLSRLLI